ncbi:OmpA family protein [Campylobacter corcagiensis]|uniref:OmpA family protein n=1 Tax=Campylobacter corcagiensis TaxID=1448857 RepID=A0A7M1LIJ4_9BACT|nr:OmpA family protein [Campylobacter corcagiensis]QKF64854.1 OmpA domain-containing protein [Campylobacter corcagiensis]QOQ88183.1 OmpA family protein [Campylobacter corcagiensis]
MKANNNSKDTFWIAYADLMAGLFFVFVLLIGGIIVKYVLTQSDLKEKEASFLSTLSMLKGEQQKNSELEELNKIFNERLNELDIEAKDLRQKEGVYIFEIGELEKVVTALKDKNKDLNQTLYELYGQNAKKDKDLEDLKSDYNKSLKNSELKITYLMEQISSKDASLARIMADLNITRNRIQNLAGVGVRVISDIKQSLGSSVSIDEKSGALTLLSSVLFDKGSSTLKDEAKPELKATLEKYFGVLLNSDEIRNNLDTIVIEGHTDTDGSYLFNLKLSQDRAYAVMEFINEWNKDERLKSYLTASGRSFTMPVLNSDGSENMDKSRRIEIKFTLSNRQTIEEIGKLLDYNKTAF